MTTVAREGGAGADVEDATGGGEAGGRPLRRAPRPDPMVWARAGLALVVALGFLLVNTAYNQGRFSPPLDDVYIHLPYARQIGLGHFLEYQTGQPPSTGAS